jgi:uncharacterized protein (TIGR02145 family)
MKLSVILSAGIVLLTFKSLAQVHGSFIDKRDGKIYQTVKIGNQTWMGENLAYKSGKWALGYARDSNYVIEYGYLYRYYSVCNACPYGWRLPSKKDFKRLLKNLNLSDSLYYDALKVGGSSGFNAKLSGWNHYLGLGQGQLHETTSFWTSSLNFIFFGAYRLEVNKKGNIVTLSADYKDYGYSIRCILK